MGESPSDSPLCETERLIDDSHSGSSSKAETAATAICEGMKLHDEGEYEQAIEEFTTTDAIWFDVPTAVARGGAIGYVEALRSKDRLDDPSTDSPLSNRTLWELVKSSLIARGEILGINRRYGIRTTQAWYQHKTGGDYWTPFLDAQRAVVQAAIDDPQYPRKGSDGTQGYGPEPVVYLLAVELHDLHSTERWKQAQQIMTMYFEQILRLREKETDD